MRVLNGWNFRFGLSKFYLKNTNILKMKQHADYPLVEESQAEGVAWAFQGPNQEPERYPFKFPTLGAEEIRIKQSYFGLCYTDCHLVNQDWFDVNYPLVPGHEILGRVTHLGENVKGFKVGDLVGFGFIRDSCGKCEQCYQGFDNLCGNVKNHLIPIPQFGGFASHVQAPAKWAFPIPNNLPEEVVPPLLCAGITVFAPLQRYGAKGKECCIVGIGGLGHLAIKFSAALGMKTSVVSTSASKREEALSYGATDFILSSDAEALKANVGRFDLILLCAHAGSTELFRAYFDLLKNGGELVQVGVFHRDTKISLDFNQVVPTQKSYIGSLVGSREETYQMLEFAAKHNIVPTCEHFQFEDFKKAYNHLLKGTPKYRCVVKV